MSVELIQKMSISAFVIAGLLFAAAIAIFFLFNIPKVFGEVSGLTARKSIENIRQQNEKTGNKAYKPSPINAERGKVTDKISPSGKLEQKVGNVGVSVGTAKLRKADAANEINGNETTVLESTAAETTVLNAVSADTSAAGTYNQVHADNYWVDKSANIGITVDFEIGFIGSTEIIE